MQSLLGPNSPIRDIWPEFRPRKEQIQMAEAVLHSLTKGHRLIVEAGTGVGKTLAYLLPALVWIQKTSQRVLISTETRALQSQIFSKDLPLAKRILGMENLQAEICFGASNYLCKRRLEGVLQKGEIPASMANRLDAFLQIEDKTKTGLRKDFAGSVSAEFWQGVGRDADDCLGKKCLHYSESYYFLARERWRKSQILIANHSLLAAHFASNQALLPHIDACIIDEAHRFPEIFHKSFTQEASFLEFTKLIYNLGPGFGDLLGQAERLRTALVQSLNLKREPRVRLTRPLNLQGLSELIQECQKAEDTLAKELSKLNSQALLAFNEEDASLAMEESLEEKKLNNRLQILSGNRRLFERLQSGPDKDYVLWIETENKKTERISPRIHYAPLESGNILQEYLFAEELPVVFTSATLSSGGHEPFLFYQRNLGLQKKSSTASLLLRSPFDYPQQALLYLPRQMPDPSHERESPRYYEALAFEIHRLLELSRGGAFVLFTSRKALRRVREILGEPAHFSGASYRILSQLGDGGADEALRNFRSDSNAALFGLATFWQGVDIPGDHLRQVILTKLPFQAPDDPLLAARTEELKQRGENAFMALQLPQATISLKQGFGRLIRTEKDRGLVAILDPRILTKRYGQEILSALPPARRLGSFAELEAAWKSLFACV